MDAVSVQALGKPWASMTRVLVDFWSTESRADASQKQDLTSTFTERRRAELNRCTGFCRPSICYIQMPLQPSDLHFHQSKCLQVPRYVRKLVDSRSTSPACSGGAIDRVSVVSSRRWST
jgi:hypothetical protein